MDSRKRPDPHLGGGAAGGIPQPQRQGVGQYLHGSSHADLPHWGGLRSLHGAEHWPPAEGHCFHHGDGWEFKEYKLY